MTGRDAACMRLGTWPAYLDLDHDVNVSYSRDERRESCLFEVEARTAWPNITTEERLDVKIGRRLEYLCPLSPCEVPQVCIFTHLS